MNLPGSESAEPGGDEPSTPPAEPERTGSRGDAAAGRWIRVAETSEVPSGSALELAAGTLSVALFNRDGAYLAIGNVCPHGKGGRLAAGSLMGDVVTCPFHGWMFKLDSGECIHHPGVAATTYPTRVTGTTVEVLLPVPR
jgi:nitrite reductase (NADH) small subunit